MHTVDKIQLIHLFSIFLLCSSHHQHAVGLSAYHSHSLCYVCALSVAEDLCLLDVSLSVGLFLILCVYHMEVLEQNNRTPVKVECVAVENTHTCISTFEVVTQTVIPSQILHCRDKTPMLHITN